MSTENQKIDIILDCDPGYDDAAAILLAAGNPNVNILAITVVAGNQSIAKGPATRLPSLRWRAFMTFRSRRAPRVP